MKFNEKTRELKAEAGKFLATKDLNNVYGSVMYLGIYDSKDNYVEVEEAAKKEIEAAKEEAYKKEMEARNLDRLEK